MARIQSILRRSRPDVKTGVKRFGPITVDFNKHLVLLNDKPVDLTTTEFEILKLFLRQPVMVLSRDQILDNLWDIEADAALF